MICRFNTIALLTIYKPADVVRISSPHSNRAQIVNPYHLAYQQELVYSESIVAQTIWNMNPATSNTETANKNITIDALTINGFFFGDWSVITSENRIGQGDCIVRLEPKVMQLLLILVSRHGEVCTRESLLNELWPSAETGESSLTRAISELRKALGDQRKPARYIDTIQRVGYKAIAPIRPLQQAASLDQTKNRKTNPPSEAEQALTMARYLLVRRNEPDIRQAIELLEQCANQKPHYAQLWAMLAYAKTVLHSYSLEPGALYIRKAHEHALHALELDGANGLAWSVLGNLAHDDWKWSEAQQQYERAFRYESNEPIVLEGYARLLQNMGRIDRARELASLACEIEPLAASVYLALGWMMLDSNPDQSLQSLIKARQLGAQTLFTDNLECLIHHRKGWDEQSIFLWKQMNQNRHNDSCWLWPDYFLDAMIDNKFNVNVTTIIRERIQLGQLNAGLAPLMLSMSGDIDSAYDMTYIALERRSYFAVSPWLNEMKTYRSDARFEQVLNSIGLAEHHPNYSKPINRSE